MINSKHIVQVTKFKYTNCVERVKKRYQSYFFLSNDCDIILFLLTHSRKQIFRGSSLYAILTSNYYDTMRLKLRPRNFRAYRWSSPFMLRSSFILKIARERARGRGGCAREIIQEIISRKAQTPKTRALEGDRDKARR